MHCNLKIFKTNLKYQRLELCVNFVLNTVPNFETNVSCENAYRLYAKKEANTVQYVSEYVSNIQYTKHVQNLIVRANYVHSILETVPTMYTLPAPSKPANAAGTAAPTSRTWRINQGLK